jgi:hypothetical protein
MNKKFLLMALGFLLLLANRVTSAPPSGSRGIYVWGYNYREYDYTDTYGTRRYRGWSSIRIYQSNAANEVPFSLDWQWGVVFTLNGLPYGNDVPWKFTDQPWYMLTFFGAERLDVWCQMHYAYFGEPDVWAATDRVFGPPRNYLYADGSPMLEMVRDEETPHFSGTYFFPAGSPGGPGGGGGAGP